MLATVWKKQMLETQAPEAMFPECHLTFVIRNILPAVAFNHPPAQRTVKIKLTEEQSRQLRLLKVGTQDGQPIYEEVAQVIVEPNNPFKRN